MPSGRWKILSALIPLVAAGCAAGASQDQQIAVARQQWGDCVMDEVKRLDDGKTDPVSLAVGIAPRCKPQYLALTQVMAAPMVTQRGDYEMRQEMRQGEIQLVTAAIVSWRSRNR